jgi:hypothetical protein
MEDHLRMKGWRKCKRRKEDPFSKFRMVQDWQKENVEKKRIEFYFIYISICGWEQGT